MDDDDDDDPDHNDYPSAASQQAIGSHVDLAAASNLLANGGGGGGGGPRTSTPSAAQHQQHSQHPQHQQHQTQDMSQALLPHQLQQQQQQQQPQAQMQASHQSVDPSLVKTTEVFAHESGYSGLNVESALAKRLAREPGHRLAQQRRPDQLLNLARRSNVEALFAHIAGEPAHVPCKNCHKGHGPWTSCIVVEGQMCGSCANCWFNASGARCSFHETRNPQLAQQQQQQQQQHPPIIPTSAVGLSATDPTYHYPTPHSLAHATIVGGAVAHPALLTSNPMLQQMVTRAMTDVRGADKATRQLILIDITAKQLALQIVEYEEMAAGQDPQQQQQQQPGGPGISRQGGMGDDTGA
ncbi:hypothetical protein B0T26DRAFT_652701 [Lasiosphaeria miniovina]|uniref:Uncharacterized protein n=1 Tax=Lasiosphaeria miniovina TaxID=1954250 RepID=A0AA40A4L2_9PEZI|nr:uncharacterized protein B0T26DRAFT_652701 [Lasiosphaeria miniovina]KAK0709157.1 hypothetical protein B0T26DRAFT_652701 [Lasiosphaeria miniovina]